MGVSAATSDAGASALPLPLANYVFGVLCIAPQNTVIGQGAQHVLKRVCDYPALQINLPVSRSARKAGSTLEGALLLLADHLARDVFRAGLLGRCVNRSYNVLYLEDNRNLN